MRIFRRACVKGSLRAGAILLGGLLISSVGVAAPNCEPPPQEPNGEPNGDFPNGEQPAPSRRANTGDGPIVIAPGGRFQQSAEVDACAAQNGSSTGAQLFTFVSELRSRIAQQRRGPRMSGAQVQGGGASADEAIGGVSGYGRLSPFGILDYSEADRDATPRGNAYDQDSQTAILGADYRVSNDLFVGGTLNVITGDTDFEGNSGSTEVDTYLVGLHGSRYFEDNMFMDVLVTYGQLDTDIERIDTAGNRFTASPDGDAYSAEVSVGHNYSSGRLRITPLGRLLYLSGSLDGYRETRQSGGGTRQRVAEQRFDSANLELSTQADYVFLTGWGVLIPSLNVAYQHEFSDPDAARVTPVGFGGSTTQTPDTPDRNTVVVRAGVSAQFQRGWSGFASYEQLFEHDFRDRYNAVVGVRYEIF